MALKTEPLRIARSGNTTDGREITVEMLTQAANNYDRDKYTAVIWPDHQRYYSLGVVDSLSLQDNGMGGVDLYAVLQPNAYYQDNLAYGQKVFTSAELMPNFAGTGEWYLSGLAATDQPASLGTQEVRFSQQPNSKNLYSPFMAAEADTSVDPIVSAFRQFFSHLKPGSNTMASKEYTELKDDIEGLTAALTELGKGVAAFTEGGGKNDETDLAKENAELKTQVTELTTKLNQFTEQFSKLETSLKDTQEKLELAMKPGGGTESDPAPNDFKAADYI
jgi:hypothetical protein